ncbi:hypothetical protein CC1G_12623 [Coprinopsis cinerea okayama7|uniref:Uncharacterized protein n=1 Tax=Coprinopsis cinerea (strain Okayama-7 / 130 / ATCC MYA-4618 / FGSC 9003) TaxID=240176 RepID=A8NSY7_COPC7|nr:hypothetical protein CC1G_12623 [Coprinopsis cinerea okayama7\|eukprot:XP_001836119.2 hypothetical protein CC1G_12623 [Coprinopsis cinerea okayama7\
MTLPPRENGLMTTPMVTTLVDICRIAACCALVERSALVQIFFEEVVDAEAYVHAKRPGTATSKSNPQTDFKEPGMKVPVSALNDCLDSFTAADEQRSKASTTLFADTGLMGLLCLHNRVLWLANMTSTGERQFYAIVLLLKLFSHLPPSMTVGLLYDIGCQLERSCIKWDLLDGYRDCIVWGISVLEKK